MDYQTGLIILLCLINWSLGDRRVNIGVEHVFFRQKSEVHTTRSQWVVGLVLDLGAYTQYLQFTDMAVATTVDRLSVGQKYFDKMALDTGYRNHQATKYGVNYNLPDPMARFRQYQGIFKGMENEALVLKELHMKNWEDFEELKRVGHSEMEQNRMKGRETRGVRKKRVIGAILGGIAGIFSGFSMFNTVTLKKEVASLRRNQETMRAVLKESLSLINLTRMEVAENRVTINKVIESMGNLVQAYRSTVEPLMKFTITAAEIRSNLGKVRDLISAESDLIAELHQKIATLATERLSPTLLPAKELVQILKGVEVEIPPELMLPQDPRERPFYYYTALRTNTVALENELVIAITIPLLDVARKFKVMEAIALPVPYEGTDLTAVYDLEFANFAISTDGRQYIVLTLEDQLTCGKKNTNFCSLTSAIQEANSHGYCTLALYQRDQGKIDSYCKIKVSNKLKLPIAHYVSGGEWLVATAQTFNLRKHCVDSKEVEVLPVSPPFSIVVLVSGCRALADVIELPIFFEGRQEYKVQREGRIVTPPRGMRMTNLTIWKDISDKGSDLTMKIEKLGEIPGIPMEDLVRKLDDMEKQEVFEFPDNAMLYSLVGAVILVIIIGLYCGYRRRAAFMHSIVDKTEMRMKQREYEIPLVRPREKIRPAREMLIDMDDSDTMTRVDMLITPKKREQKRERALVSRPSK